MKVAISEVNLPDANNFLDNFKTAKNEGFTGIEINGTNTLDERVVTIAEACIQTGMACSAIQIRHTELIHPNFENRDAAIVRIRRMMGHAIDLSATGVIFYPHYKPLPVLPDLHPYKSALELEAEMLITQLKATLCDLAYAMGSHLFIQSVSRDESHLINSVDRANTILEKLKKHPHLHLSIDMAALIANDEDIVKIINQYHHSIGHIHIDINAVNFDLNSFVEQLNENNYQGWITLYTKEKNRELSAFTPILRYFE